MMNNLFFLSLTALTNQSDCHKAVNSQRICGTAMGVWHPGDRSAN